MKTIEGLREAARNVATGTARPVALVLAFMLIIGGLAVTDARVIVQQLSEIAAWRADGGAVAILSAPDAVDGRACDRLRLTSGITASGALRSVDPPPTLVALPASGSTFWEATPGFVDVLAGWDTTREAGLWLSASLADDIERRAGSSLATSLGPATVVGVFEEAGQGGGNSALGYSALMPVPPIGPFDACWAEIWPPDEATRELVRVTASAPLSEASDVTVSRLNPTLAATIDPEQMLRDRVTRPAGALALLLGTVLGTVAIRVRRLELASALHAGVSRSALTRQHLFEALMWLSVAALLLLPPTVWAAGTGNPSASWPVLEHQWRVVALGAAGVLLGTALGLTATREDHLFRYFKSR